MKLMKLDDNNTGRVFGLIAGASGVGKTTQITTFPKEDVLIVSLEDGLLSLAGSGYSYVVASSYEEILAIIKTPPPWAEVIYIDSLTEVYDLLKKS